MPPPARSIARQHLSPASPVVRQQFDLPADSHLVITTPSFIYAWDFSTGLRTIFKSSNSGILAAKEASDGSGVLAVASKHVVVLHDTKRGQEQSWGLNDAEDDEIRHLQYTQDAKCLFLSTKLTNDIQRYSIERRGLLSPARAHHSSPTALAISPTAHLMVSASDDPPTVYLKSLQHNSAAVLVEPRASEAVVCVAAFHPERPNIFLLAFRDGTLAAYDGSRVSRRHQGSFSNQETVNDGEIAHFTNLHRTTAKAVTKNGISSRAASIAGAAFLQGYKSRAISIGSDGRCRLVDFADGGIILRTWHAKAPLTSVSVLSVRSQRHDERGMRKVTHSSSHTIGGPTSTNNLIAVGRADGKVHIYDSVGILLAQKTISELGEKVISVEWAKGRSPRPIITSDGVREVSDAPTMPLTASTPIKSSVPNLGSTVLPKSRARHSSTPRGLGLPPALRRPDESGQKQSARGDRRFTVHPDEAAEGTVRHTPSPRRGSVAPAQAGAYHDLFSPVKSPATRLRSPEPIGNRLTSSPRPRPRLSSQTFIKSPEPDASLPSRTVAKPRNLALFPSTESHATSSSGSGTARPGNEMSGEAYQVRRTSTQISPRKKRRTSFKPVAILATRTERTAHGAAAPPNDNAKVLADLRKMSGAIQGGQQGSVLAAFGGSRPSRPDIAAQKRYVGRKGPGVQKAWHPGNVLERETTWITDSWQDEASEGDIWLTDETDKEAKQLQRRRLAPMQRPPGRQTSRSRVDSKGTFSTTGQPVSPRAAITQPIRRMDGSTEDDPYGTARTHLSPPDGVFTPSSADVRELFPRTSSLSPTRKRSPHKRVQRSPPKHERALQEITGNTLGRQERSPWAKAKAAKTEDTPPKPRCICAGTATRVSELEDEVGRLKGEVLAMKAAMRRSGVPLPAAVRAMR